MITKESSCVKRRLKIYINGVDLVKFKYNYDDKIVFPMLILVNYSFQVSKKGVFSFSIFYLVLEIFRFLTYAN